MFTLFENGPRSSCFHIFGADLPAPKMVAIAALLLHKQPTFFTLSFSHLSHRHICKPTFFLQLPASRSAFFAGSKPHSKTMIALVETSAFRTGDSEKNLELIEQEALVKDSSDFGYQFTAQGLEPTLNRLSKWFVSILFGAFILWRHDVESLWIAMGSVLNALLSVALKQILNQERPSATSKSDPGMPSSHAQCLFYTVIFCILSITDTFGVNEITFITSALTLAAGSYFSWLRVSQKYHTLSQVAVGATVGSIFSSLWYWSWHTTVLDAYNSFMWARVIIVSMGLGFCLGFLIYVIQHWLKDED